MPNQPHTFIPCARSPIPERHKTCHLPSCHLLASDPIHQILNNPLIPVAGDPAYEGEIERRRKIAEQEQKEEAFRDAACRLIAITEGTDIYEYREEADIWICRWCCERQPEHAAQCAWLLFVRSFAALSPSPPETTS